MSFETTPEPASLDALVEPSETVLPSGHPPSRPRNKWLRPILYFCLVAVLALIVWRVYQNQQHARQAAADAAASLQGRSVPVQVATVEQKPMPIFVTALGIVTPYNSVTVKARVSGELLPVKFIEGQQVKQGQTIMNIDPRPYKAALNQAKGNLAHDQALLKNAQAELRRYTALYDAGVVSKETLDANQATQGQYEGSLEADKAAVETAQLQLQWCSIQAPINGRIGLRLVDQGNVISANSTNLVVINQFQPIAVNFTLPENQLPPVLAKLSSIHPLVAEAYDRADTQRLATGQLLTADNQIDPTTGTDKLKAIFDNRDQSLFPSQFVNVHLIMEQRAYALVVPSAAIQTGLQGSFVWVTVPDPKDPRRTIVQRRPVKIALAEGQTTILDSGVEPGLNVVIDGADRLKDGAAVIVSMPRQHSTRDKSNPAPSGPAAGGIHTEGAGKAR